MLGVPYVQLNVSEASALGLPILAGYGVGVFRDWEDAVQRFTAPVRRFEPDPAAGARYREMARYYRALLEDHGAVWRDLELATSLSPGGARP